MLDTKTASAPKKIDQKRFELIESKILELEETGLKFPPNYSPQNAARSAWLILQETVTRDKKPVLEVCTQASIANALLKMATLGLNPVKKQGYFIPYGDKLEFQPSYQGSIATAKRHGLKKISANLIYKGDSFEYAIDQDGSIKVTKHTQSFESLGKDIIGVYAVTTLEDSGIDTTVMTIEEVRKSWAQGATNGSSPAHKNFEGEMAKKTVINRACKTIINSSDDAALFDDEPKHSRTEAYVKSEIEKNANKKEISFDDEPEPEKNVPSKSHEELAKEGLPQMQFDA
jgi:recombination protein RecT